MYSDLQLRYLEVMKIPAWEPRASLADSNPLVDSTVFDSTLIDWLLKQPVGVVATENVYAIGPLASSLLIVSDAPVGAPTGVSPTQPFSGAAARMYDAMLLAIEQSRSTCRLASLCQPGLVDDFSVEQLLHDNPPDVVLFFVRPGGEHGQTESMIARDPVHRISDTGIRCVVSYHPDYLLRQPALKRDAWEDLKQVRTLLSQSTENCL